MNNDTASQQEVHDAIKVALQAAGIKAFITGARISVFLKDGRGAHYLPLDELDTEL